MDYPKALAMLWRRPSHHRTSSPGPDPSVRCRHCGGARLKLSYRRRDKTASADSNGAQTVFILRCAACEGFTTVSA